MSAAASTLPSGLKVNPRLSTWVRFNADRTVTIATGKVEIGQGIVTAMAQIAAEELDLELAQIRMVAGDTATGPDEGITSGSRSISEGGIALRCACAEVRDVLLTAAASHLGCPAAELAVQVGRFVRREQPTSLSYWDLPHRALLDVNATGRVAPKPASSHTIVGFDVPRLDLPDKVMGRPRFLQDIELPGMLFGRIVRPVSGEARLLSFDAAAVRAVPGVISVVEDGSFIGVIAEREEQAVAARAVALAAAQWEPVSLPTDDGDVSRWLTEQPSVDKVLVDWRDEVAASRGVRSFAARYTKPYLVHGAIGPSCALARVTDGTHEVWSHSQSVFPLRREIALVLQIPDERVIVHHAEGSGCYGHNGADDVALDAVLLSRAVGGHPVQVQWMRDDEFAWEPYGPAMVVDIHAKLGNDGMIVQWALDGWSNGHLSRPGVAADVGRASSLIAAWHLSDPVPRAPQIDPSMGANGVEHGGMSRNAVSTIYEFSNQKVVGHLVQEIPLRASSLRAIGAYANIFAIESFMDELAMAAGIDPLDFRLRHLKDPRARAVLELAAQRAGWVRGVESDGTNGRGIACARYSNHLGYFALVVEVDVDPDLRVKRVVAAVDVGQIVNPDGVINQTEGGIIQAISWTLKEQLRFGRNGERSLNWEDYPILDFTEVPEIEVHLISRPEEEPLGAGEMTMGPTAAAIANAISHALGVRIRDIPINREKILAA